VSSPIFERLAARHTDVQFAKIDVDAQQQISQAFGITGMPTFIICKEGAEVERIRGFDGAHFERSMEEKITKHKVGKVVSSPYDHLMPKGYSDLTPEVSAPGLEGANITNGSSLRSIMEDGPSAISSESDDQVIIYIPFNSSVKIHSLIICSSTNRPRKIKLYINKPNILTFDDTQVEPSMQDVEIVFQDNIAVVPLRFVKFQRVSSLIVFVESGDGSETTSIERIIPVGDAGGPLKQSLPKQDEQG